RLPASGDRNARALLLEQLRRRKSDPARPAGHQSRLASELRHDFTSSKRRMAAATPRRESAARSILDDRVVDLLVDRTDLERPGRRCRAARRPIKRGVERRKVEQEEAAELLLRLGEWTVLYESPSLLHLHGRGSRDLLQRRTAHVDACRDERF